MEKKKFAKDFKSSTEKEALKLNLGGLLNLSQGEQSNAIFPEINSADGTSKRNSPRRINNRINKMQLSNIRSEEEDKEDSPV